MCYCQFIDGVGLVAGNLIALYIRFWDQNLWKSSNTERVECDLSNIITVSRVREEHVDLSGPKWDLYGYDK
jgi:hypothetical protein